MSNISKEETLKSIQEFVHDDGIQFIDANDTFDFECQRCGKCCMHRGDIIVNPFDVYNAAKYLNISPADFAKQNLSFMLGGQSRIPILLLKEGKNGWCTLLTRDEKSGLFGCSINPAKPGACANHPIGIVRTLKNDVDNNTSHEKDLQFIKVESCANSKGHNHPQLVKDWVKPYTDNIAEINVAHYIQTLSEHYYSSALFDYITNQILCNMVDTDEQKNNPAFLWKIHSIQDYLFFGYINYDINKPFIEQANENIKALRKTFMSTRRILTSAVSELSEEAKEKCKIECGKHCFDWLEKEVTE